MGCFYEEEEEKEEEGRNEEGKKGSLLRRCKRGKEGMRGEEEDGGCSLRKERDTIGVLFVVKWGVCRGTWGVTSSCLIYNDIKLSIFNVDYKFG